MKQALFSLTPIGGVGEIGSNFTLISTHDSDIIIDCGLLFPYEDFFDINYLIPDFSFLKAERLKSIIITHGHEDHIGALIHFIVRFPELPIHAGKFTQELIKKKCVERNIKPQFVTYQESSVIEIADLEFHPIHVTHSIPETFGLFVKDRAATWGALYISDFKYDLNPMYEKPFNIEKVITLTKSVERSAYFLDSTNALLNIKTDSERDLLPDLEFLISREDRRLFFTLFASNIYRLNSICLLGKKHKRKIVVMGRSVEFYIKAAIAAGYFEGITEEDILDGSQVDPKNDRLIVLVSGCQGDFLSALRRLSYGEDSTFKLASTDKVIFSSKVIPGNEKKISRIMNKITESGAEVISAYDYRIHASGHPGLKDLQMILDQVQPDVYFPIHGESYFLKRHQDWVKKNYIKIKAELFYNGHRVDFFSDKNYRISEFKAVEPEIIHGKDLVIEKTQISQRRKLACNGVVFLSIDIKKKKLILSTQGLPLMANSHQDKLEKNLWNRISGDLAGRNEDYLKDQLRIIVRQFYQALLGYKPVTQVHLIA